MDNDSDLELRDLRNRIRHSTAHVLADVVTRMFPEAKLAIGPPTEEGFYYDFLVKEPFTDEILSTIEKSMKEVIKSGLQFQSHEYTREEALELNANEPLKLEIINEIPLDEAITTYSHGKFEDLCAGPHVEKTSQIPAFKLLNVAGAYWRGDEKQPMLQRIYGTAFESKAALKEHLNRVEEAKKRDHRLLGKQLDLFSIHEETGPGLIIWHPKGSRIRALIEDFWKVEHRRRGYDVIYTPHIGRANLWETSGHLGFYKENMYPAMDMDGQEYYLKPMNCPFHVMYYNTKRRSYRDLPIRLGELGTVYRYERGGVVQGLLRVRGLTQDDAHIFCRPDQVEDEVNGVLDLTFYLLDAFGFNKYDVMLATKPAKAVGSDEQWELATESLRNTLDHRSIPFNIDDGGGAFYGPKIDVHIQDAIGRRWQITTVQFDFNLPERFGLNYIAEDGEQHQPYMVHRAILGSLERFIGVLIEHYSGSFPVWLSPVQAVIIPIADRHINFAEEISKEFSRSDIRVETDARNERMNARIRDAQLQKIPYMLIVGDREIEAGGAAVRLRNGTDLGTIKTGDIIDLINKDIDSKN